MTLYVALLHHPARNRDGETITTSLTNLDLHDIARSCRTFGAHRYFVVHPKPAQIRMANRILDHWLSGYGSQVNPDRKEALETIRLVSTLDDVKEAIRAECQENPFIVATGANLEKPTIFVEKLKKKIAGQTPVLIVFGTGSGLAEEVFSGVDALLEPIHGTTGYNHLSVRSAAAIYLDRLTRNEPPFDVNR